MKTAMLQSPKRTSKRGIDQLFSLEKARHLREMARQQAELELVILSHQDLRDRLFSLAGAGVTEG